MRVSRRCTNGAHHVSAIPPVARPRNRRGRSPPGTSHQDEGAETFPMLRAEVERSIASVAPAPCRRPRGAPPRRLVALGGGTGLPVVLRGLKKALFPARPGGSTPPDLERLTAIVNVADDGGSSGRLRRAYGVLPPGDIRNCLVALADEGSPLSPV